MLFHQLAFLLRRTRLPGMTQCFGTPPEFSQSERCHLLRLFSLGLSSTDMKLEVSHVSSTRPACALFAETGCDPFYRNALSIAVTSIRYGARSSRQISCAVVMVFEIRTLWLIRLPAKNENATTKECSSPKSRFDSSHMEPACSRCSYNDCVSLFYHSALRFQLKCTRIPCALLLMIA